jgi:hypothetical protein
MQDGSSEGAKPLKKRKVAPTLATMNDNFGMMYSPMWPGSMMPQNILMMNQMMNPQHQQTGQAQALEGLSALATSSAQLAQQHQLAKQQAMLAQRAMQMNPAQIGWQGLNLQQLHQVNLAQDSVSWMRVCV